MSLPTHNSGSKFRILVIEDDAEVARLILLNLSRSGLDCRYAPDGPTGVAAFKEANPHLVLLDLMLPGFDGRTVCMQIREISTVPIIIMTALSDEEPQLQCFKLGADDYVTKPFSPKLLVARLVAHLRRVYAYDSDPDEDTTPATANGISVPPGFARCDNCGYSGQSQTFDMRDKNGLRSRICPRCQRRDKITVAGA